MAEREFRLKIDDEEALDQIVQALNASVRRKIMCLLRSSCYSIAELAKLLKLPISTVCFHLNILRKAGFVSVTVKKNTRGNAKLIARQIDRLSIDFLPEDYENRQHQFSQEIPLGSFFDAHVEAGCGMANEKEIIVSDDLPGAFFSPERYDAQIIWFSKGYLEYRVPNYMLKDKQVSVWSYQRAHGEDTAPHVKASRCPVAAGALRGHSKIDGTRNAADCAQPLPEPSVLEVPLTRNAVLATGQSPRSRRPARHSIETLRPRGERSKRLAGGLMAHEGIHAQLLSPGGPRIAPRRDTKPHRWSKLEKLTRV